MNFLAFENPFPVLRQTGLAVLAALVTSSVFASAEDDYQKGLSAYRSSDITSAMEPLMRAADAGHPAAQALYGELLDYAEMDELAASYLTRAADQGNPSGMFGLAKLYLTGEIKAPDAQTAPRLVRKAADLGHGNAIIALAMAYINADEKLDAANPLDGEAARRITAAAQINNREAIAALAQAYRNGEFGLAPDPAKATEWEKKLSAIVQTKPSGTQSK